MEFSRLLKISVASSCLAFAGYTQAFCGWEDLPTAQPGPGALSKSDASVASSKQAVTSRKPITEDSSTTFQIARDPKSGKIIGIVGSDGIVRVFGQASLAGGIHRSSGSGNPQMVPECDSSSYSFEVEGLPPVEVSGPSAQYPDTWRPLLDDVLLAEGGGAAPATPKPDPDKEKRCNDQANACLKTANDTASKVEAACLSLVPQINVTRWSAALKAMAIAACYSASSQIKDSLNTKCFAQKATCMAN